MEKLRFIIQNGNLRVGRVKRHEHLTTQGEIAGGGFVVRTEIGVFESMVFYGSSSDYGSVSSSELTEAIKKLHPKDKLREFRCFFSEALVEEDAIKAPLEFISYSNKENEGNS